MKRQKWGSSVGELHNSKVNNDSQRMKLLVVIITLLTFFVCAGIGYTLAFFSANRENETDVLSFGRIMIHQTKMFHFIYGRHFIQQVH